VHAVPVSAPLTRSRTVLTLVVGAPAGRHHSRVKVAENGTREATADSVTPFAFNPTN